MNPKTFSHTIARRHNFTGINQAVLIALVFDTVIRLNPRHLAENPGAVLMIDTLGLDKDDLTPAIVGAMDDVKHTGTKKEQIRVAEQYIGNTARFLKPIGRAWGIWFNCAHANIGHPDLTQAQVKAFSELYTPQGVVEFLNAMAKTLVQNEGQEQYQTVAHYVLDHIAPEFGSTDNNVVSALLPTVIKTEGNLTQQVATQVMRGLSHQAADPQKDVPREVLETASQYHQTFGNGSHNDHTGRQGSRQPHARS